jgi:hypothetical protein
MAWQVLSFSSPLNQTFCCYHCMVFVVCLSDGVSESRLIVIHSFGDSVTHSLGFRVLGFTNIFWNVLCRARSHFAQLSSRQRLSSLRTWKWIAEDPYPTLTTEELNYAPNNYSSAFALWIRRPKAGWMGYDAEVGDTSILGDTTTLKSAIVD